MNTSRSERTSFLTAAAVFLGILLSVEHLGRRKSSELAPRFAAMARAAPHTVVVLGDSTANEGVSPTAIREASGPDTINFAVPSGTGFYVRALRPQVPWNARVVLFGATPVPVLDTWALQREERHLASLSELAQHGQLNSEILLSRASHLYRYSYQAYPKLWSVVVPPATARLQRTTDVTGFDAVRQLQPLSVPERDRLAEAKVRLWLGRSHDAGTFRRDMLTEGLSQWRAQGSRIVLLLMPLSSPLRSRFANAFPDASVLTNWVHVAAALGAPLVDCRSAMTDDAFYDDDHLDATSAADFSRHLAPWLAALTRGEDATPPSRCTLVRSDAVQ